MKKRFSLSNLGFNLTVLLLLFVGMAPAAGVAPALFVDGVVLGAGIVYNFAPPVQGAAFMALQKEMWVADLAENLFPANAFYKNSIDDSAWVEGKKVHVPQAGSPPTVLTNNTSWPLTATQRTDTDLEYTIDEFSTEPTHLQHSEEVELSYDKRASILLNHRSVLETKFAVKMARNWAPTTAAQYVSTSGAARAAHVAGQTGNRNALVYADLVKAQAILNAQDVPMDGRYMLIDAYLYADLQNISEFKTIEALGKDVITNGAVGRVAGFDIFVRSTALRYDNAGTPALTAEGSAVDITDNLAALCWHKDFVRRAEGSVANGGVMIFENTDDALYQGDVFSALIRGGGRKNYTNGRGVVAIIEAQ